MTDTFSNATAATCEREPLCVLDYNIQDACPQPVSYQPYCIRDAGVLRYNRESDSHRLNTTTTLPESLSLTEYPVKCEYCGEQPRPSLNLTWLQESETAPLFCCTPRQQLCKMLVKQRCLIEGRHNLNTDTLTSLENKPATELDDLLFQDRRMEDYKFILDLPTEFGTLPELRIINDYSIQPPVAETFVPTPKVLSFRLSCAPQKGCWTLYPRSTTEKCLQTEGEETQDLVTFCDHLPRHFGICHHQDGTELLQKYYSNGMTFLTLLPDGSGNATSPLMSYTHPYRHGNSYPSGLLAVIVVSEENGRVCIVYDDSDSSCQPIRAVFQSDGKSTCYHRNGKIWLCLNRSGGQVLDEQGTRVRQWCWSSPTPLHPVFLSLNKTVGVRVLGKERVFVSFLAKGKQAKFSVGTTCIQGEPKTDDTASGATVLKDELCVLATKIRIHVAIQHLHQCLMTPLLPKTTQAPSSPGHCPKASGSQCS